MRHAPTEPGRHVVIAGGSGFLGQSLTRFLTQRGHRVTVISRSRPALGAWRPWDGRTLGDWAQALDAADALVNFTGRSVDCRKTPENRRLILTSRVDSCRVLGQALRSVSRPPPVWIQSATAHIVGDPLPLDTLCDEATPPGPMHELAPSVGVAWEAAMDEALLPGQRGIKLRISFVLGPAGGALVKLARITRLGLGGTVGSGRQWISWIHVEDLNRLIEQSIDDPAYRGIYMTTAPVPVTNRDFMRAMRRAYRRPWSPPAPAFGVRLVSRWVMNTDPELALLGRRCVPTRLLREHGFSFSFDTVEAALHALARHAP